ncbi:amidase [Parenemella sanctibonifatiensis]|uniref:Amidase n=1 Tax=Parenemella sanctibonifatiensis TaxID=2016505 RepID=A0A255EBN9_9ACTN|nr:amidase [Parenemella sanctibonifatiensis]OYN88978.1 amidase [Parenemella sanctibonifatiensis]
MAEEHASGLDDLSAEALATAIRIREVSVAEVTDHFLALAETDRNGAYVAVAAEAARTRAVELDHALADDPTSVADAPLLGVPFPIKDLNQVAGLPFEAGSALLAGNVADTDDPLVTRARAAGAVIIGKTSTPEFGLPAYTEPEGRPAATTPWGNGTRMAGGSSGGAAAGVAAGLFPIAHGSDGGGSLRIPASCCGLVAHKPSRGLISPAPGVDGAGLAVPGVLSRTVRDQVLGIQALTVGQGDEGRADGDWFRSRQLPADALERIEEPAARLRVGLLTAPLVVAETEIHPEAIRAAERAAAGLEAAGHELVEAPVPFPADAWNSFRALWSVMAKSVPVPPEAESMLRPLTRWLRSGADEVSGLAYAEAVAAVQQLNRDVAHGWADLDLVIAPTLAQPPLPVGALRDDEDPAGDFLAQMKFTPWSSVANLTGRPCLNVPIHRAVVGDEDGSGEELPFGASIWGRPGEDLLVLRAGRLLEQTDPWPLRPGS